MTRRRTVLFFLSNVSNFRSSKTSIVRQFCQLGHSTVRSTGFKVAKPNVFTLIEFIFASILQKKKSLKNNFLKLSFGQYIFVTPTANIEFFVVDKMR